MHKDQLFLNFWDDGTIEKIFFNLVTTNYLYTVGPYV